MAGWLSALWIAAALVTASTARADIYFWEDGDGVIHFSNQDAPPKASLYMREIATPTPPETTPIQPEIDREALSAELARKQAQTQQRLEEANRQLKEALDRVDDLTESVSRSQAQAEAAAESARQAELEAQAAREDRSYAKERVIVHAAPYRKYGKYDTHRRHYKERHHDRKHKFKNRHDRHRKHDKIFVLPYKNGKSKIEKKVKPHRRNPFQYHIPRPILPPEKHRIPRAYGVR